MRTSEPTLRADVRRLLGSFEGGEHGAPGDAQTEIGYTVEREPDGWVATRESGWRWRERSPERLLQWLVQDMTRAVVERTPHVVVHAGGAARRGTAVILPGPPDAGKTTLTAALVRDGWEYLSDEATGIEAGGGLALAFPKPLSLDADMPASLGTLDGLGFEIAHAVDPQRLIPPAELGAHVVASPCPVGLIVFPRYERASSTVVEEVGSAEALTELATHTFGFDRRPRECLDLLARVVTDAQCVRLVSGRLDSAVSAVNTLYDSCIPRVPTSPEEL